MITSASFWPIFPGVFTIQQLRMQLFEFFVHKRHQAITCNSRRSCCLLADRETVVKPECKKAKTSLHTTEHSPLPHPPPPHTHNTTTYLDPIHVFMVVQVQRCGWCAHKRVVLGRQGRLPAPLSLEKCVSVWCEPVCVQQCALCIAHVEE